MSYSPNVDQAIDTKFMWLEVHRKIESVKNEQQDLVSFTGAFVQMFNNPTASMFDWVNYTRTCLNYAYVCLLNFREDKEIENKRAIAADGAKLIEGFMVRTLGDVHWAQLYPNKEINIEERLTELLKEAKELLDRLDTRLLSTDGFTQAYDKTKSEVNIDDSLVKSYVILAEIEGFFKAYLSDLLPM